MRIVTADDEPLALRALMDSIRQVEPAAVVEGFRSPEDVIEYAKQNRVDVAFLDIEMGSWDGLTLAKRLKELNGKTNIIFVTGYSKYAVDAFGMYASGYILKPVAAKDVKNAMENLRIPVERRSVSGISVQTFGNFEVFRDGIPVRFARSKAKEMFAYLVHKKGTGCTVKELAAVLFEDKEYNLSLQRQMQTIISSMMKTLREAGGQDIVRRRYNNLSVDIAAIDCDYYRFMMWDAKAVNSYTGEYMANYSWGEFTVGYLDNLVN